MPFNIGPGELILVLIIALIVVGPGKLPDVGAAIGKSLLSFGHFSRCAMAAVRKTNHGARTNFGAAQDIRAAFQVVRLNANAACLVDECHSTTDFKVLKCQCGLQQRMIDHARNVFVGIVHS